MMRSSILGASTLLNVLIQHLLLQSLFWTKTWRAFRASNPRTVYIINLSFTKALQGQTPHEKWTGRKPSVDHMRIFGSIVHVKQTNRNLGKLEDRSKLMIFIGYELKGSEVDNFLKISIKTSNAAEFLNQIFKILSHQEQMILSSSINEKTYLQGFLERVLEAIQVCSL